MRNSILTGIIVILFLIPALSQYEWIHTDGPLGSYVSALYSNDSFAFAPAGDFFFRTNDGMNWEKIDEDVGYLIGIRRDTLVNLYRDPGTELMKIKISHDNGKTWTIRSVHPKITYHGGIAVSSNGIYISQGNYSLLFRSSDNGETWDSLAPPFQYGHDLWAFDNKIYLSNSSQLWRADENGENWQDISPPVESVSDYLIDILVTKEHIIVACEEHVFQSHDYGFTWNYSEIPKLSNAYKLAIADSLVYLMSRSLLRSDDYGNNWHVLLEEEGNPSLITYLTFTGFKEKYLCRSYNKGIFRWDENMHQLIENNEGMGKGVIYDLSGSKLKIWAACGNGVFAYDLFKQRWDPRAELPQPAFQYSSIAAGDNGWVITNEAYKPFYYFSQDEGESWDTIYPQIDGSPVYAHRLAIFGDKICLFDEINGSLMSSDTGETWIHLPLYSYDTKIVEFKGKFYSNGFNDIYESGNLDQPWLKREVPFSILNLFASQDFLYAVSSNDLDLTELFVSSDGINWEYANEGLKQLPSYDFTEVYDAYFFQDKKDYYGFWGNEGLHVSRDSPGNWTLLIPGLHGRDYVSSDSVVYLGEEGLYKSELLNPYLTSIEKIEQAYRPLNIFPNPSNGHFMIVSSSHQAGAGNLFIYSANGQLKHVESVDDVSAPMVIQSESFENGVYVVRLHTINTSELGLVLIH